MTKPKLPNWSELPQDLIQEIANKQTNYVDYIHTRSISKTWGSSIPKRPNKLLSQLPFLLLPHHKSSTSHRGLYNLPDGKTYLLHLPETLEKHCCGSSNGWLIMVDESPRMFLLNPLTRATIDLPSLSTLPLFPTQLIFQNSLMLNEHFIVREKLHVRDTFVLKAILSADPSLSKDVMVVIIYGSNQNLAFCRMGDVSWTLIHGNSHYNDVIFLEGKLFAVDQLGRISTCVINGKPSGRDYTMTCFVDSSTVSTKTCNYMQWYLASLDHTEEGLLLVARYRKIIPHYEYKTERFEVYKFDKSKGSVGWLNVENLGEKVLFLGLSSSHCISAKDYGNCRGNCIYFTDDFKRVFKDYVWEGHDFGVFNFEDGSLRSINFEEYPVENPTFPKMLFYEQSVHRDTSLFALPPPIWFTVSP